MNGLYYVRNPWRGRLIGSGAVHNELDSTAGFDLGEARRTRWRAESSSSWTVSQMIDAGLLLLFKPPQVLIEEALLIAVPVEPHGGRRLRDHLS